jgi:hypothetical protein
MTIDKDQLYATFNHSSQRREKLADLATRKALDLPVEDDMQITTNTTYQGLGRCGSLLLALAMLASGGGGALGIAGLLGWLQPARDNSTPTFAPQEFEVTFFAEDGAPIAVNDKGENDK